MQLPKLNRPWSWAADTLLAAFAATILVQPLYLATYLDAWNSIESTFIADARFLREHWPHPGWQPNWYTGTRFDYVYPPALRYGTAALSLLRDIPTARAYHLYIAILYAIGIAGVYVFTRAGSRSRWVALWAAGATAVVSPAFLLFENFRNDYWGVYYMPVRLGALIRYGEGPHISALALLPLSLAAAWFGLRRGRPGMLAASALAAALVVSNNFYGATALAIFFPILAWSLWLVECDRMVWLRAAAVGVLAYGLCAFWLTPSYLRVTLDNMRFVSSPGHAWSAMLLAAAVAVYAGVSYRLVRGRKERAWPCFVLGSLGLLGLNVIGNQWYDFRVFGEPGRLIPELDLVIFLAVGLVFAWMARHGRWWRVAAVALAIACLVPGKGYIRRAWRVLPPRDTHLRRVEYTITDWVHRNLDGVRTLATGSVRFWYNAWYELPELGGGSEQGLLNMNVQPAQANAIAHPDPAVSIAWLQATGTGAVIVHDKTSQEVYHDWPQPDKFEGILEKLYDHAGDRIYRVPRRFADRARVVDAAQMRTIPVVSPEIDYPTLQRYVDAVERGPDSPAGVRRGGTDEMSLRARLEPGQLLLVQETYDAAWHPYIGARSVPIARDPMGFMLLDPGPGEHEIVLRFETPFEKRAGSALTVMTLLVVAGLFRRARRSGVPRTQAVAST